MPRVFAPADRDLLFALENRFRALGADILADRSGCLRQASATLPAAAKQDRGFPAPKGSDPRARRWHIPCKDSRAPLLYSRAGTRFSCRIQRSRTRLDN